MLSSRSVVCQIVAIDPAAASLETRDHSIREPAPIEGMGTIISKRTQRFLKSAEQQVLFRLRRRAARQVDGADHGIAPKIGHGERRFQRGEQPTGSSRAASVIADLVLPIDHTWKARDAVGHVRIERLVIAGDRRRQHALRIDHAGG